MNSSQPHLPLGCYRLDFHTDSPHSYHGYLGSAWRGVFGHALKKTVCVTKCKVCEECLLYRSCSYPYVFETPLPIGADRLRKMQTIPRPFVIESEWPRREQTSSVSLSFTLIGNANQHLPYIVYALLEAARGGLQHGPAMQPSAIQQETAAGSNDWRTILTGNGQLTPLPPAITTIPPPPDGVRISFLTPLRLRTDNIYVSPSRFRFGHLFGNLLGRVSSLQYFHAEQSLVAEFAHLSNLAKQIDFESLQVRWVDWTRYSSRQKEKLEMGGLMGQAVLRSPALKEFWPYLWLGQWIHAGKGTTMGLGKYRVESCS